jgi:hypothetical protein
MEPQPRRKWALAAILVTMSAVASVGAAGVFAAFPCPSCYHSTYTVPEPLPKQLAPPEKDTVPQPNAK